MTVFRAVFLVSIFIATTADADVLRVVNWNVSNYSGGRVAEFQTAIYGVFQGRSMSPDVFIGQEFLTAAGVTAFRDLLNQAPGSPGDWVAADFVDGPDTDSAFFYRTGRVAQCTDLTPNGVKVVAVGGNAPNHPRNIMRYDIIMSPGTTGESRMALYSVHMKSGSASADLARRLLEAQRVRDDAQALPDGWHFIIGGDFNIPNSIEGAYQELVGSQANNEGRYFDPIATPGSWQNNPSFQIVHTQAPTGAGGMDDRFDQLLLSAGLVDGDAPDYIGNPAIPYSTTTWNDPNHSLRSWGNDGTSYNGSLTIVGNTMVGQTIAQALVTSALDGGHLPVFLDLRVPPCPADADCDTDVDLADFRELFDCLELPAASQSCLEYFDLDNDFDVDMLDFSKFQIAFD